MNKKIKVLAILLVISIVASVTLYGCKKSESGNSVDVSYVVNCSLDDNAKVLYVATKITLRNNSSMTIDKIPFYLYPNAYIKDGGQVMVSNVKDGENDVEFNVDGINGTLKLNSLLLPSATKEIAISSRVSLPQGKKRLGHGDGYYNLHAFFPRVPFFDGSEFVVVPYSEVGDPYYFSQDDFVISIEYPVTYTLAHSGNRVSDEIKGEVVKSVFKIEDARDVACWVGEEKAVYEKDVDGVNVTSFGAMTMQLDAYKSATPFSIMSILKYYNIELEGKHAVVVGRSPILGKPVSMLLLNENATVTICHSRTKDLPYYTKQADILVAAVGKPKFIQADWVKDGVVLVDAGYNAGNVGDIDLEACAPKSSAYTPVPGGVGPVTIAKLMEQTVISAEKHMSK